MKIGIIDADLIGKKKHRFPNLACEKISGYYKDLGYDVELKLNYDALGNYDKVYISKVFTDTYCPINKQNKPLNVEIGGTGFFFAKAPNLPYEIEHHMPDYHLYDEWISWQLSEGGHKRTEFKEYLDYSIGFMTRGCFRKCNFCVNKKYNRVFKHSPLDEFYDSSRKKICLLDDNFFGCPNWKEMLLELQATGKRFKFKQGLDERLLTDEKCKLLFSSKYDGEITFAFDKIEDYKIIEEKLRMIRKYTYKPITFYVLCGFDNNGKYDNYFWKQDILNTFIRIELLLKYNCFPYIMRYEKYKDSCYKGMYINLARWCNQRNFIKKKSLKEFCYDLHKSNSSTIKYLEYWLKDNKEFKNFIEMKFNK